MAIVPRVSVHQRRYRAFFRPSFFSTRLRLLPTFFTAFLTDDAERPVFFLS
jgi:hypothetical protein